MEGNGRIYELRSPLAGRLVMLRGKARDYGPLERFHYRCARPATWADVWVVRYRAGVCRSCGGCGGGGGGADDESAADESGRVVGIGVLSYPTLALRARERVLGLGRLGPVERQRFVNGNVRTISRVAVHPQFRSLGIATALVRCILSNCSTRYVEALAVMGRAHPVFSAAGMREFRPEEEDKPVYYLFDRRGEGGTGVPHSGQRSVEARRS